MEEEQRARLEKVYAELHRRILTTEHMPDKSYSKATYMSISKMREILLTLLHDIDPAVSYSIVCYKNQSGKSFVTIRLSLNLDTYITLPCEQEYKHYSDFSSIVTENNVTQIEQAVSTSLSFAIRRSLTLLGFHEQTQAGQQSQAGDTHTNKDAAYTNNNYKRKQEVNPCPPRYK